MQIMLVCGLSAESHLGMARHGPFRTKRSAFDGKLRGCACLSSIDLSRWAVACYTEPARTFSPRNCAGRFASALVAHQLQGPFGELVPGWESCARRGTEGEGQQSSLWNLSILGGPPRKLTDVSEGGNGFARRNEDCISRGQRQIQQLRALADERGWKANVGNCMQSPDIPARWHGLPNGKRLAYQKATYWRAQRRSSDRELRSGYRKIQTDVLRLSSARRIELEP